MGYGTIDSSSSNSISRDFDKARSAYRENDVEASICAHQNKLNKSGTIQADEGHRKDGDMIKSLVYGGLDGALTCFAIIGGAAGGRLSPTQVLILGVSNVFADAFSMGVGDVVSTKAYHEHVAQGMSLLFYFLFLYC